MNDRDLIWVVWAFFQCTWGRYHLFGLWRWRSNTECSDAHSCKGMLVKNSYAERVTLEDALFHFVELLLDGKSQAGARAPDCPPPTVFDFSRKNMMFHCSRRHLQLNDRSDQQLESELESDQTSTIGWMIPRLIGSSKRCRCMVLKIYIFVIYLQIRIFIHQCESRGSNVV